MLFRLGLKTAKNISFDCSIAHRKGFQYGKNLIGTTHGDGAKHQDLPLLMATEFPLEWSQTKHRYVYTHHVHHKTSKDYIGVTVESSEVSIPLITIIHTVSFLLTLFRLGLKIARTLLLTALLHIEKASSTERTLSARLTEMERNTKTYLY
jgi:hypothetical protein